MLLVSQADVSDILARADRLSAKRPSSNDQMGAHITQQPIDGLAPSPAPLQTQLQRAMKRMARSLAQMARDLDDMSRRPVNPEQQAAFYAMLPALQQLESLIKALKDASLRSGSSPSRVSATGQVGHM